MLIDAPAADQIIVTVVPLSSATEDRSVSYLAELRRAGIASEMAFRGNTKKRMQRAQNSRFVLFPVELGERDEEAQVGNLSALHGEVQLKDMVSGEQAAMPFSVAIERIREAVKI